MGRLSQVACCFSSFVDVRGRRTGCDFLDLGDGVGLSPSHGTRGGLCRYDLHSGETIVHKRAGKYCERLCGDIMVVHQRKCTWGKMKTL
jgi:hypothetical protein